MGKYIIQYGLPALIILPAIMWSVRLWYTKHYGKQVKAQVKLHRATAKYEKQLGINQSTTKKEK